MIVNVFNFLQGAIEFSLLGCVEAASLACLLYFLYAKTRAPAIIAGIFPNLSLNLNYRSSLVNDFIISIRRVSKKEPKRENALVHGIGTRNMLELTPHSGRRPYNSIFDWGVYFPYVAQAVRSKKFKYPQVSSLVQKDPVFQRAIRQAAEQILREQQSSKECSEIKDPSGLTALKNERNGNQDYQQIINSQERRAVTILKNMRSTLNNFLLTFTSWLLYKLFPCFLSGVVTHTQQIEMLKTASEKAPGIPLIFLPLHRSHLDYIMVTYILTNNDIRSPLVAAGNNLQIPIFGELLRGLGAFYIKRKIDPIVGKKDILYRAILHLYLQHSLKMGHNVEFFIEGGRTRTGKPCMPKGGILSVIVNAFMDGSIPDALLVPVSVNYEKIVDGNFVHEQKGEKKVPESFGNAMLGIWKALNSNYGLMRIDFNEPYSIKELVESYNKIAKEDGTSQIYKPSTRTLQHNQSTSSLYGTDVVCEEHRNLINSISRQVVFDCAAATTVMSTNALAFLLLTRYRNGSTPHEISKGLDDLRSILKGRKDIGFSGDSFNIVSYAAGLLGEDMVQESKNSAGETILRPKGNIESWIELAYYSNMLTPHFALQSIVMTTFHSLLPNKMQKDEEHLQKNGSGISRKKLIEKALENCEVYRYEFILNKPTQNLENMLEITLDELLMQNMINTPQVYEQTEGTMETRRMARAIASYIEDKDMDDETEVLTNGYANFEQEEPDIFLTNDTIVQQKSLCEVLAPFAQTYLCVVESLFILYKNSMLETDFIKFVMKELTNKVKSQKCPYAESISIDSVRNCLKLLEKWYVIEISNQCGLRLLALGTLYETTRDSLKNVIQRIRNIVPLYNNGYF